MIKPSISETVTVYKKTYEQLEIPANSKQTRSWDR